MELMFDVNDKSGTTCPCNILAHGLAHAIFLHMDLPMQYTCTWICPCNILAHGLAHAIYLHMDLTMQYTCTWNLCLASTTNQVQLAHAIYLHMDLPMEYTCTWTCPCNILAHGLANAIYLHTILPMQYTCTCTCPCNILAHGFITKTCPCNIQRILAVKYENFSGNLLIFFLFLLKT